MNKYFKALDDVEPLAELQQCAEVLLIAHTTATGSIDIVGSARHRGEHNIVTTNLQVVLRVGCVHGEFRRHRGNQIEYQFGIKPNPVTVDSGSSFRPEFYGLGVKKVHPHRAQHLKRSEMD